jgi:NCS1 family nucleobase:cation symporter-1
MLYQNEGIYRYKYGTNWRALVTLLIIVPVNLPGLINAIDSTVDIGNHSYFYKASWLTSFFIAGFTYTVLSLIFPPTDTLVDTTVESLDDDMGYPGITADSQDPNGWEKDHSPSSSPTDNREQYALNKV